MSSVVPQEAVKAYHQRTKHRFEAYAAGPDFMDWATQPDPFRRFKGAEQVPLTLDAEHQAPRFADLFDAERVPAQPLTLESLSVLLELSFGLSAWKGYGGDRWALRCNPSSGNLHPTEAYVVAGGGVVGLDEGVYHYQSHDHVLEGRCRVDLPFSGLLIGLTSIHWREAWKYGERAFRYCQHDIGHALGALSYAAAVLGWQVRLLDGWGDQDIARLLGLDRDTDFTGVEREAPDLLCRIGPGSEQGVAIRSVLEAVDAAGIWKGQANALSRRHSHQWPVIDEVHGLTVKPRTEASADTPGAVSPLLPTPCDFKAADLIKQRRSAQAFDGVTAISLRALWRMLDATRPRAGLPPFNAWPWAPRVHLLLFVHRVEGLAPGLYVFLRNTTAEADLRSRLRDAFVWQRVEDAPGDLSLFRLVQANCRKAARSLSCHQAIASDGAFSLGMLAEFDAVLEEGAWQYRRLFWECGLIGQALYLEAEAAGVRGTGIGCFFDDPVHDIAGLTDSRYQSLYHFTVGAPVVDDRLQTLPPYDHLKR